MVRWRRAVGVGAAAAVLAGAVAVGGATSASAATTTDWGTFTLDGTARAYQGTMTLAGFPGTTFTSTSRQASVVSGASVWQGPSTPPGQQDGSSRDHTYLNQRPRVDAPNAASAAVTTYTFATATPSGGWSFVLGDIDADQATIAATAPDGSPVPTADLGFAGTYNSCSSVSPGGWSCGRGTTADPTPGSDRPTWDAATATLTGNAGAEDTAGASAWFSPSVPLGTLTITYQQRSGLPVYQTWFADRTAAVSGTVTLDGSPVAGQEAQLTTPADAPSAAATVATSTDPAGHYAFPTVVRATDAGTVTVAAPPGAVGPASAPVSTAGGDAVHDVAFTSPAGSVALLGTVVDAAGVPVADLPVTVTPSGPGTGGSASPVTTTTNDAGTFAVADLPPATAVALTVAGGTPTTITTGAVGARPVVAPPVTAPAADATSISGTVTVDGSPRAGVTLVLRSGATIVATVATDATGGYRFPELAPGTYQVDADAPAGGTGSAPSRTVTTSAGPVQAVDFAFVTPTPITTVAVTGAVRTSDDAPVAAATVTATPTSGGNATAVATAGDGTFTLDGLTPDAAYRIATAGAQPRTITAPASGSAAIGTLVVAVTTTPTPPPAPPTGPGGAGSVPPAGSGSGTTGSSSSTTGSGSGTTAVVADGSDGAGFDPGSLAFTGSHPAPALWTGAAMLLAGIVLTLAGRRRRRRGH